MILIFFLPKKRAKINILILARHQVRAYIASDHWRSWSRGVSSTFTRAGDLRSFHGFDDFTGFEILRAICWFRRNPARFGNAEIKAELSFHETLLKRGFDASIMIFSGTMCITI